jgi:SAM-dependent methyltransferase
MNTIHIAASSGFEAGAEVYARGRPDYPAALDAWLNSSLHLGPGKAVLDLGAGTGKFTGRLVGTGATITAVEPVDAMRAQLVQGWPQVTALKGTAESIPVPDGSFDAVVCAQAFHWFATSAALAEIRRVLKPGGVLGLVWNTGDLSVPWVAAFRAMLEPYEGDAPRFNSGEWRRVFPATGFGPLVESRFRHGHVGPPETVIVDRLLSVSYIASLPDAERNALAARIRAAIASRPELAGKAEISSPYETLAFATTKL